jgi:hypothetical protein
MAALRIFRSIVPPGRLAGSGDMPHAAAIPGASHWVSLCSPFWPRSPAFGTCGAHFVGMNAAHIPWNYYDRPADIWLEEHWRAKRPMLYEKAGISGPASLSR